MFILTTQYENVKLTEYADKMELKQSKNILKHFISLRNQINAQKELKLYIWIENFVFDLKKNQGLTSFYAGIKTGTDNRYQPIEIDNRY